MKRLFQILLFALLAGTACKKSPQSHTADIAGSHQWHGTEKGTSTSASGGTFGYTYTLNTTYTITVYNETTIEMMGKEFTLAETNRSSEYLLFKEKTKGLSSITYYYSAKTLKYEETRDASRIEMVSP